MLRSLVGSEMCIRDSPLQSLYFFAMTIPGSLVGAFITFAEPGLYTPYDLSLIHI